MAYDAGLLERCRDALDALGISGVRDKNVFGMRGLMRGKQMFAAVGERGIIVKVVAADYPKMLKREGVRPFAPGGDRLGTWVEVDDEIIADDPELRDWLQTGLRALR